MPSDDIAISVRNLTKSYRLFGHPGDRIKQFFSLGLKQYHREFTALKDVSFDIKKGETVGIIGRNGSGKSTLLQLICGILKPTSGTLRVRGRISALLELGAGFNTEFTGRENVYFHGTLMGFTKAQMDERFDAIAAFADIGGFIDQPVRTYSSGMFVRLAFAVAVHIEPEILVIDEALAVGDAAFQRKCFDKIAELQNQAVTILIVSHSPYWVERLCHNAAIMEAGELTGFWQSKEVLHRYHDHIQASFARLSQLPITQRDGTQEIMFERVSIELIDGSQTDKVRYGDSFRIVAEIDARRPMKNIRVCFFIVSAGQEIVTLACSNGITETKIYHGRHRIEFQMDHCQLTSGSYYLNAHISDGLLPLDTMNNAAALHVSLKDRTALDLSSDHGVYVCQGKWLKV